MKIMFYVVASLAILPILGVSYFILRSFQNNRVKLNEIAARIGGKLKGGITTIGYIEGVYNTKKIKISLAWPSQYTPSKLIIELFKIAPFKMKIKKRTRTHHFLKKLHLLREFNIGISDFDEKFLIRTNDEMSCMNYLSQYKIRTSIEQIINQSFSLAFLKDRVKLIKICTVNKEERKELQGELLRNLSLKKLMAIQNSIIEKSLDINSIMDILENLYILTGEF